MGQTAPLTLVGGRTLTVPTRWPVPAMGRRRAARVEHWSGSAVACVVAGVLLLTLLLHGTWWQGVILGGLDERPQVLRKA